MKLTVCKNPFDLTRDHEAVEIFPGESVGAALERQGIDGRYVVACNGELLPPERAIAHKATAGEELMLVADVGDSKTFRTIAMIGVAVAAAAFAGPLGGFLASSFGVTAGSTAAAALVGIAGAAISVAGGLLVNGIASLFEDAPGGQTYGVLGPATTARSGIPIPKGYGRMRAAGNTVESWVDIQGSNGDAHDVDDGADTIGRQYINCRIDYGFGPGRALENLRLNGRDLTEYADVAYCILYGTNDQAPVTADDSRWVVVNRTTTGDTTNNEPTTAFDTINNNYPQSQRVRVGQPIVVSGHRTDTEKLTVFVVFPQGVWRYDEDMVIKRLAIAYRVYYRPSGTSTWTIAPTGDHYYYNIRQTILRQATIIDGLTPGRYDIKVEKVGSGAVSNPLEYIEHENNMFGDQLWLESVQETSYTTLSYPNKIQVCLRFMATGQLSGSDVNLEADITYGLRSALPAELADLPEDCPAAVAYDIWHDDLIGSAQPDSRTDLDFFKRWAELSQTLVDDGKGGNQRLAVFNGVFDKGMSIWQALNTVGVMSRANLQRVGTKLTGWLDVDDVPVQTFHVGNMIAGTYQKTYLSLEDRAQEIAVTIADADDDYKTRNPVRVLTNATLSSSEALKRTSVNLLGCTNKEQAYYWALLQLRHNQALLRTHKFRTNIKGVRCRTGNVILLQQDVSQWGYGGLLQPGSTASQLIVDRDDLQFSDSAGSYNVTVLHPALLRMPATIVAIDGNLLSVSGYDGTASIRRVIQGDVDAAITKVGPVDEAGNYAIYVEDVTGLTAGDAGLWDIDVLETRNVTNVQGCVVTLDTPLSAAPVEFGDYIYQSVWKKAIRARIRGMRKMFGELRYEITAVDHSNDIYDMPAPPFGAPSTGGSGGTGGGTGGGDDGGGDGGSDPYDPHDGEDEYDPGDPTEGDTEPPDDNPYDDAGGGDDDGSGYQ